MKAVLYADWMCFRRSTKVLAVLLACFTVAAIAGGQPMMIAAMVMMLGYMFPNTVFSYEQACGWDRLCLSMPIMRRDVVTGRFVLGLLVNTALMVFCMALVIIYSIGVNPTQEIWECIVAVLGCEALTLIIMGGEMTAAYKWGIRKASYILMGIIWAPLLLFSGLNFMGVKLPKLYWLIAHLEAFTEGQFILVAGAAVVVALVIYLIFWRICVHIYEKREV